MRLGLGRRSRTEPSERLQRQGCSLPFLRCDTCDCRRPRGRVCPSCACSIDNIPLGYTRFRTQKVIFVPAPIGGPLPPASSHTEKGNTA